MDDRQQSFSYPLSQPNIGHPSLMALNSTPIALITDLLLCPQTNMITIGSFCPRNEQTTETRIPCQGKVEWVGVTGVGHGPQR